MSEYLELLKRRRDATPPPGNAPNVQSNVSFRKAIDYIELLEKETAEKTVFINSQNIAINDLQKQLEANEVYLLNRVKQAERIPEELFDGFKVFNNLNDEAVRRTGSLQVSDVLDVVVKLIKERINNV